MGKEKETNLREFWILETGPDAFFVNKLSLKG